MKISRSLNWEIPQFEMFLKSQKKNMRQICKYDNLEPDKFRHQQILEYTSYYWNIQIIENWDFL